MIAKQLLRSGTSIGSNIREAQNAESKNDFINKIKVAAKEADETEYWLLLCKHSDSYPSDDNMLADVNEHQKLNAHTQIFSNYLIPKFSNYIIYALTEKIKFR